MFAAPNNIRTVEGAVSYREAKDRGGVWTSSRLSRQEIFQAMCELPRTARERDRPRSREQRAAWRVEMSDNWMDRAAWPDSSPDLWTVHSDPLAPPAVDILGGTLD